MNIHHTKYKGDLTVSKVVADLIEKRWFVLTPLYSEHLAFDVLAYKETDKGPRYIRVQVKAHQKFGRKIGWKNNTGLVNKETYNEKTIDFFASWIPNVDSVIYVPIIMVPKKGKVYITSELKNTNQSFWWYEDFTKVSKLRREKRQSKEFGYTYDVMTAGRKAAIDRGAYSKARHYGTTVAKLQRLIWESSFGNVGKKFKCSDVAIKKLALRHGCVIPPIGYHIMSEDRQKRCRKRYRAKIRQVLENKTKI
jgi:hypothetical protein